MANNQPSYSPSDPNYLYDLLTHLSNVSDPNYKQNINAYNKMTGLDVNGRYQGYNAARYMLPAVYQQLAGQLGFYNSLQPMAQQSTSALLTRLTNPDTMTQQYRNQATAAGQSTLQNVMQRLKSGGAGIGAQQGAQLATANQANSAGNAFQAQMNSPEGQAQRLNAILGTIASQTPNFGNLEALHNIELGTPRNQSGLETIGNLAGGALSSWASGGFKMPGAGGAGRSVGGGIGGGIGNLTSQFGIPPDGSRYTFDQYGFPVAVPTYPGSSGMDYYG